jgi:Fe-S cluster assembly protein SufD
MQQKNQTGVSWYEQQFAALERGLNGSAGSAVHTLRRQALARFVETGFPTTRDEEWRFTNVAPLARLECVLPTQSARVTAKDIAPYILPGVSHRLVFVNGRWSPELSSVHALPPGVRVESLAKAFRRDEQEVLADLSSIALLNDHPFTALQTAFLMDGAYVSVPDRTECPDPVELLFVVTPEQSPLAVHPRNLIRMGNRSRLSVVETYVGLGTAPYFTNMVSEVLVGADAVLEHDKLQVENAHAYHIGSAYIRLGERSVATSNSIALGGGLVRNTVTAAFAGQHAECTLNGLTLTTGTQLIDNHTVIDHAHPNCASHELYKAIHDGHSRGVFNGKIFVRKDAQKTDARQTNKTLLLSDDATVDTKPQLEIFADDVKCTHGATVGQLDEEQVFYLRTRGIGEVEARDILTFAFAADVIDRIHVDALRERLDDLLHKRLLQGRVHTVES